MTDQVQPGQNAVQSTGVEKSSTQPSSNQAASLPPSYQAEKLPAVPGTGVPQIGEPQGQQGQQGQPQVQGTLAGVWDWIKNGIGNIGRAFKNSAPDWSTIAKAGAFTALSPAAGLAYGIYKAGKEWPNFTRNISTAFLKHSGANFENAGTTIAQATKGIFNSSDHQIRMDDYDRHLNSPGVIGHLNKLTPEGSQQARATAINFSMMPHALHKHAFLGNYQSGMEYAKKNLETLFKAGGVHHGYNPDELENHHEFLPAVTAEFNQHPLRPLYNSAIEAAIGDIKVRYNEAKKTENPVLARRLRNNLHGLMRMHSYVSSGGKYRHDSHFSAEEIPDFHEHAIETPELVGNDLNAHLRNIAAIPANQSLPINPGIENVPNATIPYHQYKLQEEPKTPEELKDYFAQMAAYKKNPNPHNMGLSFNGNNAPQRPAMPQIGIGDGVGAVGNQSGVNGFGGGQPNQFSGGLGRDDERNDLGDMYAQSVPKTRENSGGILSKVSNKLFGDGTKDFGVGPGVGSVRPGVENFRGLDSSDFIEKNNVDQGSAQELQKKSKEFTGGPRNWQDIDVGANVYKGYGKEEDEQGIAGVAPNDVIKSVNRRGVPGPIASPEQNIEAFQQNKADEALRRNAEGPAYFEDRNNQAGNNTSIGLQKKIDAQIANFEKQKAEFAAKLKQHQDDAEEAGKSSAEAIDTLTKLKEDKAQEIEKKYEDYVTSRNKRIDDTKTRLDEAAVKIRKDFEDVKNLHIKETKQAEENNKRTKQELQVELEKLKKENQDDVNKSEKDKRDALAKIQEDHDNNIARADLNYNNALADIREKKYEAEFKAQADLKNIADKTELEKKLAEKGVEELKQKLVKEKADLEAEHNKAVEDQKQKHQEDLEKKAHVFKSEAFDAEQAHYEAMQRLDTERRIEIDAQQREKDTAQKLRERYESANKRVEQANDTIHFSNRVFHKHRNEVEHAVMSHAFAAARQAKKDDGLYVDKMSVGPTTEMSYNPTPGQASRNTKHFNLEHIVMPRLDKDTPHKKDIINFVNRGIAEVLGRNDPNAIKEPDMPWGFRGEKSERWEQAKEKINSAIEDNFFLQMDEPNNQENNKTLEVLKEAKKIFDDPKFIHEAMAQYRPLDPSQIKSKRVRQDKERETAFDIHRVKIDRAMEELRNHELSKYNVPENQPGELEKIEAAHRELEERAKQLNIHISRKAKNIRTLSHAGALGEHKLYEEHQEPPPKNDFSGQAFINPNLEDREAQTKSRNLGINNDAVAARLVPIPGPEQEVQAIPDAGEDRDAQTEPRNLGMNKGVVAGRVDRVPRENQEVQAVPAAGDREVQAVPNIGSGESQTERLLAEEKQKGYKIDPYKEEFFRGLNDAHEKLNDLYGRFMENKKGLNKLLKNTGIHATSDKRYMETKNSVDALRDEYRREFSKITSQVAKASGSMHNEELDEYKKNPHRAQRVKDILERLYGQYGDMVENKEHIAKHNTSSEVLKLFLEQLLKKN